MIISYVDRDSKKTMTSKESSSSSSTKNQALASQDNTRRSISTVGKPTKLKAVTKVAAKRPRSPTDVKRGNFYLSTKFYWLMQSSLTEERNHYLLSEQKFANVRNIDVNMKVENPLRLF